MICHVSTSEAISCNVTPVEPPAARQPLLASCTSSQCTAHCCQPRTHHPFTRLRMPRPRALIQVPAAKPAGDGLLLCCEQLGASPECASAIMLHCAPHRPFDIALHKRLLAARLQTHCCLSSAQQQRRAQTRTSSTGRAW
eukprot:6179786-Pleurochrysis_carterae.AAC.8